MRGVVEAIANNSLSSVYSASPRRESLKSALLVTVSIKKLEKLT